MAKKSKNKSAGKNSIIDINQTLVNNMDYNPPVSDSDDDEFDQLLNSFINSENSGDNVIPDDAKVASLPEDNRAEKETLRREIAGVDLGADENELAQAYANFIEAVTAIADLRNILMPQFSFKPSMMLPNYKPSTGKKVVSDASMCWDIMFQAFPEKLSMLKPSSSDEEFLSFAEGLSDQNLQLAIISYVEILIDIENCEISYEEKRLKAQRKRIERELYEEYQRRRERKARFIEAIQKRNFPIDADRLINNYFKTAAKDAEGAYTALTKNPALYAPINTNQIRPRFFGLLKVTPKDGIRVNRRLGEFLKHLKV